MQYETRAGDRPEMFGTGALQWDGGGIVLNEQHNRQAPIMRFTPETRDGKVVIDAALPDTSPRPGRRHDRSATARSAECRLSSVPMKKPSATASG